MFNFFNEIKNKIGKIDENFYNDYNLVNISGHLVYIEGHLGIFTISKESIAFKVKHGRIVVEGDELSIKEITYNTLLIEGKIAKMEIF